jgi:hypothetical protein
MMEPQATTIIDYLNPQNITVVSLLCGFIVGLVRKWWVMGYQLTEMTLERDRARDREEKWKDIALQNIALSSESTREMVKLLHGRDRKDVA